MPDRNRSFDRVAHCYDETRAMPEEARHAIADGIVRVLRTVAPAPRLLEVGIGTGRIALPLARAGIGVFGVDLARAMLARLREQLPDFPVAIADAARLPFVAGAFDAALFVHVLHLLPDPIAVLRAARSVVRPGGLLLHGWVDHGDTELREVWSATAELAAELAGVTLEVRPPHERARTAFAAEAGSEPVVETPLARWREEATAAALLRHIADRVYSTTWDIPDAVMPELLRRLTPRVRALVGDLDRPLPRDDTFILSQVGIGAPP